MQITCLGQPWAIKTHADRVVTPAPYAPLKLYQGRKVFSYLNVTLRIFPLLDRRVGINPAVGTPSAKAACPVEAVYAMLIFPEFALVLSQQALRALLHRFYSEV